MVRDGLRTATTNHDTAVTESVAANVTGNVTANVTANATLL